MCYRDSVPALDLESVHIACLCGDNGHGKTALLDAITWVLWGQARSRTHDELVHQGQQDMVVELDFSVNGQRYRVSRKFTRSSRRRQGTSLLELQVAIEDSSEYSPMTGNTIRETEARIRQLLHMDYDTFINTAFLKQGEADLFTKSTPSKRKECLAEVLDLSYYQLLEDRAKSKSKDIGTVLQQIEISLELKRPEIVAKPELEKELDELKSRIAFAYPHLAEKQLSLAKIREDIQTMLASKVHLSSIETRLLAARQDVDALNIQISSHTKRVKEYQRLIEMESEIRDKSNLFLSTQINVQKSDEALSRKIALDNQAAHLENEITRTEAQLSTEASQLKLEIEQTLEPAAAMITTIESNLSLLENEWELVTKLETEISAKRNDAEECSLAMHSLDEENKRLKLAMEDTRNKFEMLEHGGINCPLCSQKLNLEGVEHLRSEYKREGLANKSKYAANSKNRLHFVNANKNILTDLANMEKEVVTLRDNLQSKSANLKRDKNESVNSDKRLSATRVKLAKLQKTLKEEDFCKSQKETLLALRTQVNNLGYNAITHEKQRKLASSLSPYTDLLRQLDDATKQLPVETESITKSQQMLERRLSTILQDTTDKQLLKDQLAHLPDKESQLVKAEVEVSQLEKDRENTQIQIGILEQRINHLNSLEIEIEKEQITYKDMLNEKSLYDDLGAAFGKNGVQALIIESAIPQIEEDANHLLGNLTENRMFLKLELKEGRRDRMSGLPSEELDIRIADEVGTRSYETFSGGEAFRINFAIRIALSKLLARRSGAPLPILFIDEGFGSQDRRGQERLTEAIQSIQNDFEKIIVITHIDEIKDAFPVRIEVQKTGIGSTFKIT